MTPWCPASHARRSSKIWWQRCQPSLSKFLHHHHSRQTFLLSPGELCGEGPGCARCDHMAARAVLLSSPLLVLTHLQRPRRQGGDGVQRQDQEGAPRDSPVRARQQLPGVGAQGGSVARALPCARGAGSVLALILSPFLSPGPGWCRAGAAPPSRTGPG